MSGRGAMSPVRPVGDAERLAIKAATRRLAKACGGADSAQHVTRLGVSALSRFGGIADEQFIPADVIADLEADCGSPVVTEQLAALQGYRLVRKGDITYADITEAFANATELAQFFTAALADGSLCAAEANRIIEMCENGVTQFREIANRAASVCLSPAEGGLPREGADAQSRSFGEPLIANSRRGQSDD